MKKIVVIDDSSFQRSKLKFVLEKNNYIVFEAEDGEEGLKIIEKEKPDCIICDLLMPKMDGFKFLKLLYDRKDRIPVIVISSNIQEPAKKLCMLYGAKAFLNKPISKELLLMQLKDILSGKG